MSNPLGSARCDLLQVTRTLRQQQLPPLLRAPGIDHRLLGGFSSVWRRLISFPHMLRAGSTPAPVTWSHACAAVRVWCLKPTPTALSTPILHLDLFSAVWVCYRGQHAGAVRTLCAPGRAAAALRAAAHIQLHRRLQRRAGAGTARNQPAQVRPANGFAPALEAAPGTPLVPRTAELTHRTRPAPPAGSTSARPRCHTAARSTALQQPSRRRRRSRRMRCLRADPRSAAARPRQTRPCSVPAARRARSAPPRSTRRRPRQSCWPPRSTCRCCRRRPSWPLLLLRRWEHPRSACSAEQVSCCEGRPVWAAGRRRTGDKAPAPGGRASGRAGGQAGGTGGVNDGCCAFCFTCAHLAAFTAASHRLPCRSCCRPASSPPTTASCFPAATPPPCGAP